MMQVAHVMLDFLIFSLLLLSAERFKTHFEISKDTEFYWLSGFTLSACVASGFHLAYYSLGYSPNFVSYTSLVVKGMLLVGALFVVYRVPVIKLNVYIFLAMGFVLSLLVSVLHVSFIFDNELIPRPMEMVFGFAFFLLALNIRNNSSFAGKYRKSLVLLSIASIIISFSGKTNDLQLIFSHIVIMCAILHILIYQHFMTKKIINGIVK